MSSQFLKKGALFILILGLISLFMYDLSFLTSIQGWITLLTVSFLEVVLGIDNIIFIAVVSDRLPKNQQAMARNLGLFVALVIRIILLFFIGWIISLTKPLFSIGEINITGRGLILLAGGIFLTIKTIQELYHKAINKHKADEHGNITTITLTNAITQIVIIDTVFSFDSILAAVGLCGNNIALMIATVIVAMVIMVLFAGPTSNFVNKHTAIKTLALFFLVAIGVMLILEGLEVHFDKGYIYFALGFALIVELLNMWERSSIAKQHNHEKKRD
jgi:predicted tellurium resistance membrane protein TerC